MSGKVRYIKIARIDKDGIDITTTLESITYITIPLSGGNRTYQILNRTRNKDFYLYYINPPENNDIPGADHSTLEYIFTGSFDSTTNYTTSYALFDPQNIIPFTTNSIDNHNFFNEDSYILGTYPQKDLYIRASGSVSASATPSTLGIYRWPSPYDTGLYSNKEKLITVDIPTGSNVAFDFSINVSESLPGDRFIFTTKFNGSLLDPPSKTKFSSSCRFFITSSTSTGPTSEVIVEPYLTQPFFNSDCDVLQGEVEGERPNPFLQDVDYSTSTTVPVNAEALASESATRATVPESYYTSLAQTNIRYNGTKNQSKEINRYVSGTYADGRERKVPLFPHIRLARQSPVNIGTYGKTPSIELKNCTYYEFDWGGGTSPEILGWGAFKMGDIYQIDSPDSVKVISPTKNYNTITTPNPYQGFQIETFNSSPGYYFQSSSMKNVTQKTGDYYYALNELEKNNLISVLTYDTTGVTPPAYLPTNPKILTSGFGVPTISNYMSSNGGTSNCEIVIKGADLWRSTNPAENLPAPTNVLSTAEFQTPSAKMNRVVRNSSGQYISSSGILTIDEIFLTSTTSSISIQEQLTQGERWFFTFYDGLQSPVDNNLLQPVPLGYTGSLAEEYPLASKGVFEIVGVSGSAGSSGVWITLSPPPLETAIIGSLFSTGYLLWKGEQGSPMVMIQDLVTGIGPGGFTTQYTPEYITDNLEQITKEFGSNKQ
tara:strand:+ start:1249 stop:3390 length:2142 start_codon:yes stop_codon:yes gene_type:complete